MEARINIAFGVDEDFVLHAAAAVASIVRFAPDGAFRFVFLHVGVDPKIQLQIEALAPRAVFVWIGVAGDDVPEFAQRGHLTRATLFRLGLEMLAPPDCHRILYLDADISIVNDIRIPWEMDLNGHPIGAVVDANVDPVDFARRFDLVEQGDYFNAGVLLIDLDMVRAERLFSRAIELIKLRGPDLHLNDQDALNWSCWGRWRRLDVAWNAQREVLVVVPGQVPADRQLGSRWPAIIHFTGAQKPWIPGAWHPWAWWYWVGMARTPFVGLVAKKYGMSFTNRLRLRLRWWRRCLMPLTAARLWQGWPTAFGVNSDRQGSAEVRSMNLGPARHPMVQPIEQSSDAPAA